MRFFIQTEGEQDTEPSEHESSKQPQVEQPPAEQNEEQEYTKYETVNSVIRSISTNRRTVLYSSGS